MSGQDDPYSRLYWRVKADQRFEHAYSCDPCWAAYTRLLIEAEASYPSPASLPRSLRAHAKAQLAADGIIELQPHDCYTVHGLANERERRSSSARQNAEARWAPQYGIAMPPQSDGNASALLNETRQDETKRDETSQGAPESGPDVWYWVTMRYPDKRTNPNLWLWLDRLAEDFGVVRLWEVMRIAYAQDRNKGTLLSRTEAVLSREIDRQESAAERERLAAARKPVVLQPTNGKAVSPEEEARLLAEYLATEKQHA
jgi:hypothetical protein